MRRRTTKTRKQRNNTTKKRNSSRCYLVWKNMTKVLMVCMGNICRSQMAEGMLRQAVLDAGLDRHVEVDSAGTHAYHIGSAPDPRAQLAIRQRGIDISQLRGRKVADEDFV